jgi:anti-anti-sigma factor
MQRKGNRDIQIACILNPGQPFFTFCGHGIQDQAHEHGITVSMRPVYSIAEGQAELMDCLRRSDVDAIIIAGVDVSLTYDVGAASTPPIPLIACLAQLDRISPACDLKPDLRRAAELAASYLVEQLQGRGKLVHIQGSMSNVDATLPRTRGFAAVVAQHPGMAIVVETEGNWERASGAQVMRAALAQHPELQGVFAHNDEMALGALEALEAAGRHDVVVVGVDAIPDALTAILDAGMAATIDAAPYTLGRLALTHALQVVQGHPVPARVLTDVRLITAANLHDAMLAAMRVLPKVLRELVKSTQAQRQLQEQIITTQQRLIRELSTPIIPVSDAILVLPLIGTIDSSRAAQVVEALLEAVSRQNAQVLIIDITGVAVVDSSVVEHLLRAARAARLLGTTVLLVGIGPEVAQTIVQLGADLSGIVTRSTLQAGLEYATTHLQR